ncbi:MAG: hypothetical protein HEQ32_07020 [Vampirovibrio sp.]
MMASYNNYGYAPLPRQAYWREADLNPQGGALVPQDPNALATNVYPTDIAPAPAPKSNNNLWGWAAAAAGTAIVATTVVMSNNKTKALEKALEEAKNLAPNNVTSTVTNAVADAGKAVTNAVGDVAQAVTHTGSYFDGLDLTGTGKRFPSPAEMANHIRSKIGAISGADVQPLTDTQKASVNTYLTGIGRKGTGFGFNHADLECKLAATSGENLLTAGKIEVLGDKHYVLPGNIRTHLGNLRNSALRGDQKAKDALANGRIHIVGHEPNGKPILVFKDASATNGLHEQKALYEMLTSEDPFLKGQANAVAVQLGHTVGTHADYHMLTKGGVTTTFAKNFDPDASDLGKFTFVDNAGNPVSPTDLINLRKNRNPQKQALWETYTFTPVSPGDGAIKPQFKVNTDVGSNKRTTAPSW